MRLELEGITKRFPGVLANDRVDLAVSEGEIVALLGENGAGKTTLMNILYGLYAADQGEIRIDGQERSFASPADAIEAGIGMVHQHFMLVPVFTVTENVVLGVEPVGGLGWLDRARARRQVRELSAEYGLEVDPDRVVEDLPVGIQQRVEIIKVLFRRAELLVLDEPTAVLTPQEVDDLFRILRSLREDGKGIIFITHKLGEALEIADRIVVMRRGRVVGETTPREADEASLARMMVGRPVELTVHKGEAEPGDPVLEVDDLVVVDDREQRAVDGISLRVHAGEVVGIAGVQGNGQTELVEAITGIRSPVSGSVRIAGEEAASAAPRWVHERGVAHVPEDRQRRGLVLDFTVAENLVLDTYHSRPYSRRRVMDWDEVDRAALRLVEEYDIRTPGVKVPVSTLSGGNQQKVIVAREFSREVRLIVAAQPTRGLDVGSIEYIHERIVAERDRGAAVLIVSTELDEIFNLADRIVVMYRGRVVADLQASTADRQEVGLYMLQGEAG